MEVINGCGGWCIERGLVSSFGANGSEDVGPGGMGLSVGHPCGTVMRQVLQAIHKDSK